MQGPSTRDEAFAMLDASLDYLTRTDWGQAGGHALAMALRSLGAAQSRWTVAHGGALAAFDACGGHSGEGQPTTRAWLKHQGRVTSQAARDLEGWTRRLSAHPLLAEAMRAGDVSESWARQLAAWNDRLPAGEIDKADKILLDAARANLDLRPDIARLAEAIYEAVRARQPDDDPPDDGYRDRDVRLAAHLGGAGRLTGDLSAECAALLATVFEAFGKAAGPEDLRSPGQRDHDALEIALRLALGVPDIPQSAGMKTQLLAMLSLAGLLKLDGASALCDAWLAARAGEPGFFAGPAAETLACTGRVTPVITGTPDWDVLSDMADVFLDGHGHQGSMSPAARLALERTLLAMAIRALSGPGGLAGFLRARLLGRPFSGRSLVLDVGDTDDIPDHIRRAVMARDGHCQWPGGCDRPASQCEPHHHVPRHQGGETSVGFLDLYCKAHHHHYIHRLGWKIIKHPDGTREAVSPSGVVIRSRQSSGPGPPGDPAA